MTTTWRERHTYTFSTFAVWQQAQHTLSEKLEVLALLGC